MWKSAAPVHLPADRMCWTAAPSGAPTLVVSATHVSNGEARLFRDREVTTDVLLASACLPRLFPAVEIEGEALYRRAYPVIPCR